jgi:putative transposase
MKYSDLNMVRAGVVGHPEEWEWCGYRELVGLRQRYRLLDVDEVLRLNGGCTTEVLVANYRAAIGDAIGRGQLHRDPKWTESIAVGGEGFIRDVREQTSYRVELETAIDGQGGWTLREAPAAYS